MKNLYKTKAYMLHHHTQSIRILFLLYSSVSWNKEKKNTNFYVKYLLNKARGRWNIFQNKNLILYISIHKREREISLNGTCIRIKRSALCLNWKRFFLNSSRTLSTSARSCGDPASGSNSQCCRPMWLFTVISHGPLPSAIFSFHIPYGNLNKVISCISGCRIIFKRETNLKTEEKRSCQDMHGDRVGCGARSSM